MNTLSEQAVLVILDIDEIEDYNRSISELEYQICDCQPEDPASLKEEKQRLQAKANTLTNNLKDEGIEIVYDGRLTQVKRDGQLWLECDRDGWREHTEPVYYTIIPELFSSFNVYILLPDAHYSKFFASHVSSDLARQHIKEQYPDAVELTSDDFETKRRERVASKKENTDGTRSIH